MAWAAKNPQLVKNAETAYELKFNKWKSRFFEQNKIDTISIAACNIGKDELNRHALNSLLQTADVILLQNVSKEITDRLKNEYRFFAHHIPLASGAGFVSLSKFPCNFEDISFWASNEDESEKRTIASKISYTRGNQVLNILSVIAEAPHDSDEELKYIWHSKVDSLLENASDLRAIVSGSGLDIAYFNDWTIVTKPPVDSRGETRHIEPDLSTILIPPELGKNIQNHNVNRQRHLTVFATINIASD
jgi:hypothetical protein